MRIVLRHTLTLSLGSPVRAAQHLLLTPKSTAQQKIEQWDISMPGMGEAASFRDGYGNAAHLVTQFKPEGPIEIVVSGTVETFDKAGVLGRVDLDPVIALFRRTGETEEAWPELTTGLSLDSGRIPLLHELMERTHAGPPAARQQQAQKSQSQSQTDGAEDTDLVSAFVGAARELDIPARYVTGYLLDDAAPKFHCWAEAWDERLGWIGFDPINNVCPTTQHVRLAAALDALSVAPVRSSPAWIEPPTESIEIEVLQPDPST